jgi:signal transduction histidine kinase
MTRNSPIRSRRAALGQAVIPVALLALLALVGGLTFHARRMESSHRATAESALRDYAAFAAWQFSSEAADLVHQTARVTLHVIDPLLRPSGATQPLPPPASLVRWADTAACGIGWAARFAFRLDLPGPDLVVAAREGTSPVDRPTRDALVARMTSLAPLSDSGGGPVWMLVDTLGGAPRAIAYAVVRGPDSLPRAVYGVEADPGALTEQLRRIAQTKALLPPSLLRDRPIDSVLALEVRRADGALLFAHGTSRDHRLAAQDTTPQESGRLVTTVALRPDAAAMLLIGGVPSTRLPMLLVFFAGSVAVAGLALVQLRRGRELARLRTQFVASVSHELRTPLAQISMFSETLLLGRERSADERQHFLSVIFREARRLTNLVERVLRFSRAEAVPRPRDASPLTPAEPRDVAEEVRDAVRTFSPLAAAAGVELRTTLEEGSVALVEPDALRQVLLNLLDNAVKFGPEGQRVTVGVARANGDVVVSVADEGPGIPPDERRRVFQPFARGAQSHTRTTPGAGIGLAVVAELVAAHAGRVWIEDAPGGRGSRVVFAMPAMRPVSEPPPPAEPALEEVTSTAGR